LRLTTPLNLPAPGRSQTLYVVFDFAEPCVFSKQSLGAIHCDLPSLRVARTLTAAGTPSSEVTVLICRVPSRGITHAPWNSLPVYLCRFAVRSSWFLLRGFSWQRRINDFVGQRPSRSPLGECVRTDLPTRTPYELQPTLPIVGSSIFLRHPIVITKPVWYRNVGLFPIDYASRPRLRDRLTLSGRTFLRKP
jgi:hypothetical protein